MPRVRPTKSIATITFPSPDYVLQSASVQAAVVATGLAAPIKNLTEFKDYLEQQLYSAESDARETEFPKDAKANMEEALAFVKDYLTVVKDAQVSMGEITVRLQDVMEVKEDTEEIVKNNAFKKAQAKALAKARDQNRLMRPNDIPF